MRAYINPYPKEQFQQKDLVITIESQEEEDALYCIFDTAAILAAMYAVAPNSLIQKSASEIRKLLKIVPTEIFNIFIDTLREKIH